MAWSTCPKCNSHNFEVVEKSQAGLKHNLKFVQCVFCGAVVGVFDNNIEQRLNELEKKVVGSESRSK
jgi:Zn ribbon nucleic-acid-binding protein